VSGIHQHPIRAVTVTLRWRPEWPYLVLTVLAWVALLAGVGGHASRPPAGRDHRRPELTAAATDDHRQPALVCPTPHPQHPELAGSAVPAQPAGHSPGGLPTALAGWMLMSVAMMVPVVLPAVRHIGFNSIRQRRQLAMSLFFVVYVGVWAAFGILALAGRRLALEALGIDARVLLAAVLAVAAGWQLTRVKRRALLACRRTVPLPPVGRRADAACARFALRQGRRCVASCWALMAVMLAVQQAAVVWMVALTALMASEELTRRGRRLLPLSAAALAMAAALVAMGTQPWWPQVAPNS
jgi:predicted metal-binding membrane protein